MNKKKIKTKFKITLNIDEDIKKKMKIFLLNKLIISKKKKNNEFSLI